MNTSVTREYFQKTHHLFGISDEPEPQLTSTEANYVVRFASVIHDGLTFGFAVSMAADLPEEVKNILNLVIFRKPTIVQRTEKLILGFWRYTCPRPANDDAGRKLQSLMSRVADEQSIDLEFVDWDPADEIAEFLDRPGPQYDIEQRLHELFRPLPETETVATTAAKWGEATEPVEASPTSSNRFIVVPYEVAYDTSLTVMARHLYTILLSYSFGKDEVWPGQERLAKVLGLKVRMLQNYLKELENRSLIEREVRGNNLTNKYRLKVLPPAIKLGGKPSNSKYRTHHRR